MRKFTFIRRYLELNRQEGSFRIKKDAVYEVNADTYEAALAQIAKKLDAAEGRIGLAPNDGFPYECTTELAKGLYLASHSMAAYCYRQEIEKAESPKLSFLEELLQAEGYSADNLYQGFYADAELMTPRGLTVHRLQCCGNKFNYLFETNNGKYQGEYDKYLFYQNMLYERADNIAGEGNN